jgi:hypothetical protein
VKQTTTICDRCGNAIVEGASGLKPEYGALANQLNGTVDLCQDCQARLVDWLRSGRQSGQHDAVAAPAGAGGDGLEVSWK